MFRLLLAFAVVTGHAGAALGSGRLAVQAFFMISGFLMAFVLNRDGAYGKLSTFYLNRALRIFPIYWVVAAATALLWLALGKLSTAAVLNPAALALVAVTNVTVVGQDMVMFLQQTADGIGFAPDFRATEPQLWRFLMIAPAWSLALELYFYLLAPYLVRRVRRMAIVAGVSAVLTLVGWHAGLADDPWTYRFFPFEIALFLVGGLAERLLLPWVQTRGSRLELFAAPAIAAVVYVGQHWVPIPEPVSTIIALVVIWFLLPWLFLFQHGRKWDVALGDLSYPMYICHWSVLALFHVPEFRIWLPPVPLPLFELPAIILLSVGLERYIARPVERLRRRLRGRAAPVDTIDPGSPREARAV